MTLSLRRWQLRLQAKNKILKKDRTKITLMLSFNLTAIGEWLKDGGKLEDAEKIQENWLHSTAENYTIDVIPTGAASEVYFHRRAGVVSAGYDGMHRFNTTSIAASEHVKEYATRLGIENISWKAWRNLIIFYVNDKPCFAAPMKEIAELQINGRVKDAGNLLDHKPVELALPIAFEENGIPKERIKIKRSNGISFNSAVEYGNALGRFSASAGAFEVQY